MPYSDRKTGLLSRPKFRIPASMAGVCGVEGYTWASPAPSSVSKQKGGCQLEHAGKLLVSSSAETEPHECAPPRQLYLIVTVMPSEG